jgi:hypothetical protein
MQVLYQSCCGMDVHKRFVVACLLWQGADGQPHKEIRRYDTMTDVAMWRWSQPECTGSRCLP